MFQPVNHFAIFEDYLPLTHGALGFILLILMNILKMYCMHHFGHSFDELTARVWQCNLQLV